MAMKEPGDLGMGLERSDRETDCDITIKMFNDAILHADLVFLSLC